MTIRKASSVIDMYRMVMLMQYWMRRVMGPNCEYRRVNLYKKQDTKTAREEKKKMTSSSFAAPMQTPNTKECFENLGMQTLQNGQCMALNARGS
jgi:hypothetical protein